MRYCKSFPILVYKGRFLPHKNSGWDVSGALSSHLNLSVAQENIGAMSACPQC